MYTMLFTFEYLWLIFMLQARSVNVTREGKKILCLNMYIYQRHLIQVNYLQKWRRFFYKYVYMILFKFNFLW